MVLQRGSGFLEGAVAEPAILAAGGDDAMILTVHLFDGFCGGQFLKEIVGAIVEPVDVAEIPVIVRGGCTHVGVDSTAGLADGFRPVIAGVVGVLPRNTVQNRAFPLAVYHCSIGILDVAGQGGLAVPSVLRRPEHLKGCGLAALAAVKVPTVIKAAAKSVNFLFICKLFNHLIL